MRPIAGAGIVKVGTSMKDQENSVWHAAQVVALSHRFSAWTRVESANQAPARHAICTLSLSFFSLLSLSLYKTVSLSLSKDPFFPTPFHKFSVSIHLSFWLSLSLYIYIYIFILRELGSYILTISEELRASPNN